MSIKKFLFLIKTKKRVKSYERKSFIVALPNPVYICKYELAWATSQFSQYLHSSFDFKPRTIEYFRNIDQIEKFCFKSWILYE